MESGEPMPRTEVYALGQAMVRLAQQWEAEAAPHQLAPRTTTRARVAAAQTACALELRGLAYPLLSAIEPGPVN